jgi:hypothetical protein
MEKNVKKPYSPVDIEINILNSNIFNIKAAEHLKNQATQLQNAVI